MDKNLLHYAFKNFYDSLSYFASINFYQNMFMEGS